MTEAAKLRKIRTLVDALESDLKDIKQILRGEKHE